MRKTLTVLVIFFSMSAACAAAPFSIDTVLTRPNLLKFSPHARVDIVEALIENRALLTAAGINSPEKFYHFISTIALESGGFTTLKENMRYRPERLLKIFRRYVETLERARQLAGNERAIANLVYGDRLGNRGSNTDDGFNYRGSGFIQLTGRYNFIKTGDALDIELEETPEEVRKPTTGLKAALEFWKRNNLIAISQTGDIVRVRKAVNGGKIGLDEVRVWYAKARKVFGPAAGLEGAEEDELQEAVAILLRKNDPLAPVTLESAEGPEDLAKALASYERANDLDVSNSTAIQLEAAADVQVSDEVIYSLTDPINLVEEREAIESANVLLTSVTDKLSKLPNDKLQLLNAILDVLLAK